MLIWTEAVRNAIVRHVARTGSPLFTRQALMDAELGAMAAETRTVGLTPAQTMGRELQQLRNAGLLQFVEPGIYRWLGEVPEAEPDTASKSVFRLPTRPEEGDGPERLYSFPSRRLQTALRLADQWIVYQVPQRGDGGDYVAVARIARVDADRLVARIVEGSYPEFGRPVPFRHEGMIVEQGLLEAGGRLNHDRAARSVRAITNADFNRIVELGLITEEDLLPRDADDDVFPPPALFEERSEWEGPVDRATMLVNRKVRRRQFRQRVLDVYGARCALTGMKLVNGGGRVETEAAHIMSVEAGGPDKVNNGIALSGTIALDVRSRAHLAETPAISSCHARSTIGTASSGLSSRIARPVSLHRPNTGHILGTCIGIERNAFTISQNLQTTDLDGIGNGPNGLAPGLRAAPCFGTFRR